ncbi:hypothetical protein RHGRI_028670 [Rhododendron griersonianum]|uniref:F-box domain-containing protein n=1 Tax=Rhododendron griersonianum TaxID=479676 RepID=A0AAV6IIL7_9ERIC|nr:hypothetical protein RHGRI_028670 [Rhododendron griersonianum]
MAIANEPPDDVLIDILSWLPAKSILRFKSVSKHWYSLIQNPSFISLHRAHARTFHCVSLVHTDGDDPYHWSMHLLPDQASHHDLDLSFVRPRLSKDFDHQGSCNGLVLLPQPPYCTWHTHYLGFAFDSETDDYRVVRFATPRETDDYRIVRFATPRETSETMRVIDHRTHIYCMSADSWKELVVVARNHDFTGYHHHPCTSLDGVFYWLSSNAYPYGHTKIDAVNTVEGWFERRSLPASVCSHLQTNLCLLNDSLALVAPLYDNWLDTQFDVWLMDEYGVQECWTKKYTIGPILGSHRPFGFQPNNEVLMTGCDNGMIVSYNHGIGDIKVYKQLCNLPEVGFLRQVFQYSENLVSVKRRLD